MKSFTHISDALLYYIGFLDFFIYITFFFNCCIRSWLAKKATREGSLLLFLFKCYFFAYRISQLDYYTQARVAAPVHSPEYRGRAHPR